MGAQVWIVGFASHIGAVFYQGAGWPHWKPLGIPGTHLPLKQGSWLTIIEISRRQIYLD